MPDINVPHVHYRNVRLRKFGYIALINVLTACQNTEDMFTMNPYTHIVVEVWTTFLRLKIPLKSINT